MNPQRTTTHTLGGLSALLIAASALIGCSPTPAPTPTPPAAFASEEEAFAAAEAVYREYIDASNSVDLAEPETFAPLEQFTTGKYGSEEREELSTMHAEGYVSGGEIIVEWFKGISLEPDQGVSATACNNVAATTLEDHEGNSLVDPDRPDRYALRVQFDLIDGMLAISSSEAVEDSQCSTD